MANAINSKGIKHPNTFSISKGETLLSREVESINESIRLILSTAKGELFGSPNFGSTLYEYTYDYMTASLSDAIITTIVNDLNEQETRIFLERDDVTTRIEGNSLVIDINYNLRYTDYSTSYQYIVSIQEDQ